jgi:hypothetical protein
VGYLIDPPEVVEGRYVAVFCQTDLADGLAIQFLRDHGIGGRRRRTRSARIRFWTAR